MTKPKTSKIPVLSCWKEISSYLGKGVRTAQRYERELELPVYRLGKGPKSPVHAFPAELSSWLLRQSRNGKPPEPKACKDSSRERISGTTRQLTRRSSALVEQMIRSVTLQQKQSLVLRGTLQDLRGRLKRFNGRDPVAARIVHDQLVSAQKGLTLVLKGMVRPQLPGRNHAEGD